ncbi:LysR family substrate-binding domain-containing protein [Microbacterium koreense]|uniref:LysR family substrate-binding domain-containing protein n=1 Tax=Microbacterium koreense TaxID=323761 RepID=A0ABW2ZMA9_9MICO
MAKRTRKNASSAPRPPRGTSPAPAPSGPFRLGAIPGATPGKWIDVWRERMPRTPLELVHLNVAEQRDGLMSGTVDAALVRLPIDRDGLHVIPLYDELPVVVASTDSALTAVDELHREDLAGEVLIVPADDVLDITVDDEIAPSFPPPRDTAEAIATVAAGVGAVIVPMSLARLHHRKDVTYRPLIDGPTSTVGLAWVAERTTPAIETFIGIVRGRTANSSRS